MKNNRKRFIRTKDNRLFDCCYYGIDTWGLSSQDSIVKINGKYYFDCWTSSCYPEYDDYSEYIEIGVVKDSDEIEDVVDEIKVTEVGKVALINGEVVAIYKNFGDGDMFHIPGFEWDVLTNKVYSHN